MGGQGYTGSCWWKTCGSSFTTLLMEFEMKQFFSAISKTLAARSRSRGWRMVSRGRSCISVSWYPIFSTLSSLPFASELKLTNSSLEFAAIARKVVMKHALTEATKKCSGVQMPSCP